MPRDFEVYLEDMRQAVGKINTYVADLSREQFARDGKTVDAVIRNLEIIAKRRRWCQSPSALLIPKSNGERLPVCVTSWPTNTLKLTSISSGTFLRANCLR